MKWRQDQLSSPGHIQNTIQQHTSELADSQAEKKNLDLHGSHSCGYASTSAKVYGARI